MSSCEHAQRRSSRAAFRLPTRTRLGRVTRIGKEMNIQPYKVARHESASESSADSDALSARALVRIGVRRRLCAVRTKSAGGREGEERGRGARERSDGATERGSEGARERGRESARLPTIDRFSGGARIFLTVWSNVYTDGQKWARWARQMRDRWMGVRWWLLAPRARTFFDRTHF